MPWQIALLSLTCLCLAFLIRRFQRKRAARLWMDAKLLTALRKASEGIDMVSILEPLLQFFYDVTQGAGSGVVIYAAQSVRVYTHPHVTRAYECLFQGQVQIRKGFFAKLQHPLAFARKKPGWADVDTWQTMQSLARELRLAWVLPVAHRGETFGVALLEHPAQGEYHSEDIRLLCYIADMLGLLLANNKLYELTREKDRRIRALKESLIDFSDDASDDSYMLQKRFQDKLWKAEKRFKELKELLEQREEKEAFLRHELKTPLAAMAAYLEALLAKEELPFDRKDNVQILYAEVMRLVDLVNASRYEPLGAKLGGNADKLAAAPSATPTCEVKISSVIQDAVTLFQAQADKAKIALSTHLDHPQVLAKIDPQALKQVILNLLSNALKYSPAHTSVQISSNRLADKNEIVITIADKGGGIDEAFIQKIFEPNVRVHQNSNRIAGQGLGLAISKELVEQWGGRIWARNHNGGSEFCISLPAVKEIEHGR